MTPDDIERLQQMIEHGGMEAFTLIPASLNKVILERQWEGRVDKNGDRFNSFEAFVTHRLWQGLETTIDELLLYCRNQPKIKKLVLAQMDKARALGINQHTIGSNIVRPSRHGNSSTYTAKRLKRDRPDLFAQVLEGELSPNAAAIAAGWRKKKTPLEQLRYWWQKCTQSQQHEFLQELERRTNMETTTETPDEPTPAPQPVPQPPPPPSNGD